MKMTEFLDAGRLTDAFPLPHDLPFTRAMALDAGVSRRALDSLLAQGLIRRPVKGVYLGTHVGDTLALRAACLRLVAPKDAVVVDRHAAWLHGAPMVLAPGEHLSARPVRLFRPSGHGRVRTDIADSGERNLTDEDVMEVQGMTVTTPIRTAWDLGRVRWTDEAISGLDAMFRLGAFSRDEFLAGIERFRKMRWVTTLRAIGPYADGRSESPGESVLRLRCIEARVHVVPQVVVPCGDRIARLDLADADLLLAFEYDGVEWHSSDDQLAHDRERRAELAEQGWTIRALGCDDVFGRARECDRIIREAAREARLLRGRRTA